MSAGLTIRADGLEWPLDTYLDARGFIRTNGEVPDFARFPGLLDVVTLSGELREKQEAATIPWHDVLAAHAPDGSLQFGPCSNCGEWIVPVSWHQEPGEKGPVMVIEDGFCTRCEDAMEWDW